MAKTVHNAHGSGNTSLVKSLSIIKLVSDGIKCSIDVGYINEICRLSRYLERMYGYCSVISDACSKVFRCSGKDVYYFNGRCWEVLGDVLFERSVMDALGSFVPEKGDLVRGRSSIMRSAYQGAGMSILHVSKAVVGFSNGVVDFSDIDNPVLHKFSDRLDVTSVLPYEYDPTADCPLWRGFLGEILRPGQIDVLQKFMGLGVVPRNNMERKVEKTLWLVGSGGNGKSVIHDVMVYVYGEDSFSDVSLFNLIKPGDEGARFVATIAGKVFNYCTEVDAGDISRYEGNFKSLVSGERQQSRKIGGNVELIDEIPYLVFNMNQQPSNRSMGKAFMRRIEIIDFRSIVSEKDQRPDLVGVLCKEASGIRNWLIEGYKRLRACGYKFTSTEESRQYMMDNDQSSMVFMGDMKYRDSPLAGKLDEEAQWVRAVDLYEEYSAWCRNKEGMEPDNMQKFGRDLKRLHYMKRRSSSGNVYALYCSRAIKYALS